MARRRTSTIEDLIEIVSKLPWWVGCLLAVVSFLVLHSIASIKPAAPVDIKDMGSFAGKQLYISFAMFGQYVLPAVFGFGALLSILQNKQQQKRYGVVKSQPAPNALFDMSWQEFEGLVTEFFRRRDYTVKQTGGNGPDGGVDIVLTKGNDMYLVQCKQWKAYKVGVQIVRELHGVMAASGAAGGFVVTAGEFTADAKEFAKGLNINLFNGTRLHQMIREAEQTLSARAASTQSKVTAPACPTCAQEMVLRMARKGANTGQQFWGCCCFPKCRGTLPLEPTI